MRCQTLANLCTFLALAGQVHSQTWLTYDINLKSRIPASSGIEPGTEGQGGIAWTQRRFVQANGRFFFVAKGPLGAELYSSSGAPGSTRLVKDICPGAASSDPMHLQAAGQLVYFMASNGTHGRELWVSDGSETGTRLVKDIEPGIASSSSSELCAVGQKLIFAVTTRSGATELWISDGSSVGTQRLKVIHPSAGGKLRHTASFGSLVVFAAEDSTHGEEPWISDGTASGTMLLKECMPGSLGGSPTGFHDLGNGLCLFSALAGGAGRELWVTDGTSAGTTLLKDIRPGSRAGLAFSDTLCDGAVINSRLFFPADDGVNGWALWVSDGSAAGTQMLRAFPLGSSTRQSLGSIYPAAGRAWFGAEEPNLGQQPWVSDGTTSGTVRLGLTNAAGPSDPWGFASVGSGSLVVFSARGGTSLGRELWITDGTANAATLLKDIHPGATSSDARYLTPLANGQVAFRAANPDVGSELWKTDGTSSGTQVLGNIAPEMGYGSYPKNMLRFWERTLFSATDGYSGREPWAFDFTPRNLQQLMDIRVGSSSSYFDYPVRLGDQVLFRATDGTNGYGLWRTDGTAGGTRMIQGVQPRSDMSPYYLTRWKDRVFFRGTEPSSGSEIWVTDGTANGTSLLSDIRPGSSSSSPQDFCAAGSLLFFRAFAQDSNGSLGSELFVTDGTPSGTRMLADINPGSSSSTPSHLTEHNGQVYFVATDGVHGRELWTSDGTTAGTRMVCDLESGASNSSPSYLVSWKGQLWFTAYTTQTGNELFVSDGSKSGTQLFKDIVPGGASSTPKYLSPCGSRRLYFAADDGQGAGNELWATDGSASGTGLFADINAGSFDSFPQMTGEAGLPGMLAMRGRLYFAATADRYTGSELIELYHGAMAIAHGEGYAAPHRAPPSLTSEDPVIGSQMKLSGTVSSGSNSLVVTLCGVPNSRPRRLVPGRLVFSRVDLALPWIVLHSSVPSGGNFEATVAIPNSPALRGLYLAAQSWVLGTDNKQGFDLSNGLFWFFGS